MNFKLFFSVVATIMSLVLVGMLFLILFGISRNPQLAANLNGDLILVSIFIVWGCIVYLFMNQKTK